MTIRFAWTTLPLAAAVALTGLLTGCADGARSHDAPLTITWQTIETLPEQQAMHRRILEEFHQAHPHIRVRVVYDTSRFQKLNVQLAGNAAPDVFYYIVDRLPAVARRGAVHDLSEQFAPLADRFFPEVVEPCRIDGRLMMMPFHFSTDILFYNRDWFTAAGLAPPGEDDAGWAWPDFAAAAKRLARHRQVRFATVLPRPLLLVQSFGGALFADHQCVVNSPESEAALAYYRSLVAEGIAPTTAAMAEMEAFDGVNLFRSQNIAMLVGRTYMLTELDKITEFEWSAAPVPAGNVRWSRLSVGGNCVWSGTKHPREAWTFVEFYSTRGAELSAHARNAIPALKSAAATAEFPPVMLRALEYSRLDNPWGYTFWDEFNQKAFFQTTDAVALGHQPPADALRAIESLANSLLSRN
jgi:multiple sugar transport system substrate-binding protein